MGVNEIPHLYLDGSLLLISKGRRGSGVCVCVGGGGGVRGEEEGEGVANLLFGYFYPSLNF